MSHSFFFGFGDEITKLAAEPGVRGRASGAFKDMNRELQMRRQKVPKPSAPMRTHEAERMGGTRVAPRPAQKMPLLDPYPKPKPDTALPKPKISLQQFKAQQRARRAEGKQQAISRLPGMGPAPKGKGDPYASLTEDVPISKELAEHKHRKAKAFRKANPAIFKGIKPSKDEGKAEYVAQEATRKTMGSKMTAKEIVDRYALGKKPKRRGRRRKAKMKGLPAPRTAKGGGPTPKSMLMMSPREQAKARKAKPKAVPATHRGLLSTTYYKTPRKKQPSLTSMIRKKPGVYQKRHVPALSKALGAAHARKEREAAAEAASKASRERAQRARRQSYLPLAMRGTI
jgi:hypothetical protein